MTMVSLDTALDELIALHKQGADRKELPAQQFDLGLVWPTFDEGFDRRRPDARFSADVTPQPPAPGTGPKGPRRKPPDPQRRSVQPRARSRPSDLRPSSIPVGAPTGTVTTPNEAERTRC